MVSLHQRFILTLHISVRTYRAMANVGGGAPAIGIDLGTTYSCVAVWKHNRIEIIPNDQGNRTTPSCVAFTNTEQLVGDGAKNQITKNPANTLFSQFNYNFYVLIFYAFLNFLYCLAYLLMEFQVSRG